MVFNIRDVHNRPLAAPGYISYRYHGIYGYVVIGAKDPEEALREARRSTDSVLRERLEVWDGGKYVPVIWD